MLFGLLHESTINSTLILNSTILYGHEGTMNAMLFGLLPNMSLTCQTALDVADVGSSNCRNKFHDAVVKYVLAGAKSIQFASPMNGQIGG